MATPDTVLGVLRAAERYLGDRGVDAPRLSAELLLGRVLELRRLDLYLAHDRPMTESERAALRPMIAERGCHVPLAYLLGEWDFFGLTLQVDPRVLVPRPETEHLIELAADRAGGAVRAIDIGTGSGALAVALAVQHGERRVVATDVSEDALAVAAANAARHGVADRIAFACGSYWTALGDEGSFDLLVSNPPYVDPAQPELLDADVLQHEPHLALFTPADDPAAAYRAILAGASTRLTAGAWLLMETGVGASAPAFELLRAAPFLECQELLEDLAGIPRYLVARCR